MTSQLVGQLPISYAQHEINELKLEDFVQEFPLQSTGANAFAITSDSLERIWFSERNLSTIAYLDPKDGMITRFKISTDKPALEIWSIYADDGDVWFTDATESKIRRLDPSTGCLLYTSDAADE